MDHEHLHSPHSLSLDDFFLYYFIAAFLNLYVFICYFLYLYLFSIIHWCDLFPSVNLYFCNDGQSYTDSCI